MMHKKHLLCAGTCFAQIVSTLILVWTSVLTGEAIDYATSGEVGKLITSCVTIFIITLLNNLFFIAAVWMAVLYENGEKARIRTLLVKNLFRMPLFFYRKKEDAYYITMLTSDTDKVGEHYYGAIAVELKFIALFIGSVGVMTMIEPGLFLVAVIFSVIPLLASYLFEKTSQKKEMDCSKKNEALNNELLQFVQNYEMLKINNTEPKKIVEAINQVNEQKVQAEVKNGTWEAVTYNILDTINSFGELALIAIGGYLILRDRVSAGDLVTCITLSTYVGNSVSNYLRIHIKKRSMLPLKEKLSTAIDTKWKEEETFL